MKVTRKQIEKCVDIGDEVYIICGSKIIMANVTAIHDDRITTDVDECFFDEHLEYWTLLRSTAENITHQSQ
jgi:hypothetical protein